MPSCIRYICQYELLPVLEAALAANEYHVEMPLQRSVGGASAMVMMSGTVSILFTHTPGSAVVEIEVWGSAQATAAQLLESLPIELVKLPTIQGADR
jgi:hypothetical protein